MLKNKINYHLDKHNTVYLNLVNGYVSLHSTVSHMAELNDGSQSTSHKTLKLFQLTGDSLVVMQSNLYEGWLFKSDPVK